MRVTSKIRPVIRLVRAVFPYFMQTAGESRMSQEMHQDPTPDTSSHGPSPHQLTQWMYALFFLGVLSGGLFGLASVAAVILAYLKRDDMVATLYASHARWIIRTFWWGLLWLALSALATLIFIGWITGLVALVWVLYRLIKGWLALTSGQAPVADF